MTIDTHQASQGATNRPPLPLALAVNGSASLATWLLFFFLAPWFPPPMAEADAAARLAYVLPLLTWPGVLLFAMIMGTVVARVSSLAFNPIDDPESRFYRIAQRALQNTLEQTAVFVPLLLALAMRVDAASLGVVTLVVILFSVGRLLFWLGYLIHPFARAPGMAMTLNVNLGLVIWLIMDQLG